MEQNQDMVVGRNPVREALRAHRSIHKLFLLEGNKSKVLQELSGLAKNAGIPVQWVVRQKLDKLSAGAVHQGVVAFVSAYEYVDVDEMLEKAGPLPFLLILNEVNDPHNLGAILRTAEAAGVDGVIIPKRRAAALTSAVAKASAGALEYMAVARVSNIVATIDILKKKGLWIVGAHMDGMPYWDTHLDGPVALVIGGEEKGLGRLVEEKCDILVRIPMLGKGISLNASVAAAVLSYEILRQRR